MADEEIDRHSVAGDVLLFAGGRVLSGWQEVEISGGIDQAARAFALKLAREPLWRRRASGDLTPVRGGDPCRIYVGADLLITGYVDKVKPGRRADDQGIKVVGRSATADLVDCSATNNPGQWREVSLVQLAADLARPFGVAARGVGALGAPIPNFEIEQGEAAFDALERAARLRAVLVHDDAEGRLVLSRGILGKADAFLLHLDGPDGEPDPNNNVLGSDGDFSMAQRFSEIRVKGQKKGQDWDFGAAAAAVSATAFDRSVPRFRPLIVQAEDQVTTDTAQARANWEVVRRAGKGTTASVSVRGWRQYPGGPLWAPGLTVPVRDSSLGLYRDMLIVEATWRFDGQGRRVDLRLEPPEAYAPNPVLADDEGSGALKAWDHVRRDVVRGEAAQRERAARETADG